MAHHGHHLKAPQDCCSHQHESQPQPAPVSAEEMDRYYTCPMHPEIRQLGPGHCPICGMALDPESLTAIPASDPELQSMQQRFIVSAILSLPLVLMMARQPLHHFLQA